MLDPNYEIDQLKQRLRFKNLSEDIISSICENVANEIINASTDLLANAMEEAVQLGQDKRSVQFISELKAIQHGNHFMVDTESGRHNFSEPPFPMLPRLLKNAKVAEDGSLYKVIPIRDKGSSGSSGRMKVTTEAALKGINDARREAKAQRDEAGDDFRSQLTPDALKGMSTFAALQAINQVRKSFPTMREKSTEPVVAFRTASSKQDQTKQWVYPRRDMDMSSGLHDINSTLQVRLDDAIRDIIHRHETRY